MGEPKGCLKCGSMNADQKEVAITGTGLSKMFDIQHNSLSLYSVKTVGTPSSITDKVQQVVIFLICFLDKKTPLAKFYPSAKGVLSF